MKPKRPVLLGTRFERFGEHLLYLVDKVLSDTQTKQADLKGVKNELQSSPKSILDR